MFPRTAPRLILLSALLLPLTEPLAAQDAETQFRKTCMSCHSIGAGKKVGPDLKDLSKRVPHEWAVKFITGAGAMIDAGDPTATTLLREFNGVRMPDLGVTAPEAEALLKVIDDYSARGKTLGTAAIARLATPEDIRRGRLYFRGDLRFKSGAPACMSCHRVQSIGGWGGGWLGPDLTGATAKYGAGLSGVIENPSFPTMQGVFAKTPATAEEAFQVASFLKSVGPQPPDKRDVAFPILGVVGLVGGMLLGGHLGRKRLKGVRRRLKPRA